LVPLGEPLDGDPEAPDPEVSEPELPSVPVDEWRRRLELLLLLELEVSLPEVSFAPMLPRGSAALLPAEPPRSFSIPLWLVSVLGGLLFVLGDPGFVVSGPALGEPEAPGLPDPACAPATAGASRAPESSIARSVLRMIGPFRSRDSRGPRALEFNPRTNACGAGAGAPVKGPWSWCTEAGHASVTSGGRVTPSPWGHEARA
jgi:hypothetical protein